MLTTGVSLTAGYTICLWQDDGKGILRDLTGAEAERYLPTTTTRASAHQWLHK